MTMHLRIGVTGHRPAGLAQADRTNLAARIAALFAAIDAELAVGAEPGAPSHRVTLITCAAAGADSMTIACAQARGWAHEVILPYPADIYASDYAPGAERDEYQAALASAARVFALDGTRPAAAEEAADPAAAQRDRSLPYDRAGRVLLAQSDLVVGVWNGGPAGGPGGTAQVIAAAVTAGIPVAHVPLAADAPVALLWSGLNDHLLGEDTVDTVARAGIERLAGVLRALPGLGAGEPGATGSGGSAMAPRRAWLEAPMALPYRAMLWLTRARPAAAAAAAGARLETPADPAPDPRLAGRFAAADHLASAAAAAYRGAYVANFALAAAAVLLSLSGLVLPLAAKPVLLAGEIALIGAILGVTGLGRRLGWHGAWIEQRQLAERLRCLGIAARLGDLCLRGLGASTRPGVQAEACAAARELGLPAATVTPQWLGAVRADLLALITDQRGYFAREARTMHRLDHRLHRAGVVLFTATAVVCLVFLGVEAGLALSGQHLEEAALHHLALWVTLLTAAFPTLGAALHGIRMQGDYAGAAERSHAMDAQLAGLERAIRDEPADFDRLLVRMRRVMVLLTEDLDSWTYTYQGRPLVLPG